MLSSGLVVSVPVVSTRAVKSAKELNDLVWSSLHKTVEWREQLREAAEEVGSDPDQVARVVETYKWVRRDFINAILDSGTHWEERPLIENILRNGAELNPEI